MSKLNRFTDALAIQEGACNPIAIANTLVRRMDEMRAQPDFKGWDQLTQDPALRLITHQLGFLFRVYEIDTNFDEYRRLTNACRDQVESSNESA